MKHSETLTDLATALVAAQAEMPVIPKSAQGHGYKYADLTVILDTVRPVLKKHGLSVVQSVSGNGQTGITTMVLHKSGQYIADTFELPALDENKRMNVVQAMGAAITYGRRYGISAMLSLATDEDTDAHTVKGNSTEPKQTAKAGGEPDKGDELAKRRAAVKDKLTDEQRAKFAKQYEAAGLDIAKQRKVTEAMEAAAKGDEFKDQPPFETDDAIAAAVFDGEVVDAKGDLF